LKRLERLRVVAALLGGGAASLVVSGLVTQWLARGWGYADGLAASWRVPAVANSVAPILILIALVAVVAALRARRWIAGATSGVLAAAAVVLLSPKIYAPWNVYAWAHLSRETTDWATVEVPFQIAALGTATCLLGSLIWAAWRNQQAASAAKLGTSRYATERELRKAGLLSSSRTPGGDPDVGMILGLPQRGKGVIRTPKKPSNVDVYGPPRMGKGVGLVLPNILDPVPVSRIIWDDKGDAWNECSQWLVDQGFDVLRFDPSQIASERTNSWNPLSELRTDPMYAPGDALRLARILSDPDGRADKESPFFQRTAPLLMRALILEALVGESLAPTLPAIAAATSGVEESTESLLMRLKEEGAHPQVRADASNVLAMAPETRSNIEATVFSYLGVFADPLLSQHIGTSDFQILDPVTAERPVALFVTLPEKTSPIAMPLMRMFMQMLLWSLSDRLRHEEPRWRLRIIADEFASFGQMPEWRAALGRLPGVGKGVDTMLIMQSRSDLDYHYRDAAVISDLCSYHVVLPIQGKTAEWASKALGERVVERERRSWRAGTLKEHGQVSSSEDKRALLTANEIGRLGRDEALILAAGQHPYRARLIRHHEMQPWKDRVKGEASAVSRLENGVAA